jgi:diguanylate cyclase (GGDEF)-like protein/PAS domain S-box-containing protein
MSDRIGGTDTTARATMTTTTIPVSRARERLRRAQSGGGRNELFELSIDLLAVIDRAGRIIDVNPAAERILGFSPAELIGVRISDLLHPEDRDRTLALGTANTSTRSDVVKFENRYCCKDGSYRWLQWNARFTDETWYAVARDVTDRRLLEECAERDPLTSLPNRTGLSNRLADAIARLDHRPGPVAVLFVDLDRFKRINDRRGHQIGDDFLCAVAARLQDAVRAIDLVARFGGDEFVILLEELSARDSVSEIASRVVQALQEPIVIGDVEAQLDASVGVALTFSSETSPGALLHEADIAMYRAKRRGGSCVDLFDEQARAEADRALGTERELRMSVEEAELAVHFQPIVSLPDTAVSRCEALLRWQHPTRGLLLPDEFLPLAEETGTILGMGEWVLREACWQAHRWRGACPDLAVTVNVSARQLEQPEFPQIVRRVLAESELPPSALCLEVTETQIARNLNRVAPRLTALRATGVRIAIDHFGTGHASLGALRTLPFDTLKIDRSFIRGIACSTHDRAIVASIVTLGHDIGREVVAEGVETEELHSELVSIGCELAQGFFYERPRPAREVSLERIPAAE